MKTALITTTINVPTVLELYRQHGPDVMFFVAGDRKTPDEEVVKLLERLGPHAYYGIDSQHMLGYKCSRLIGENCIQRRNIALLEAVKWGADIIVSIDDDNIPMGDSISSYFSKFYAAFGDMFGRTIGTKSGFKVSSSTGWFDVGQFLDPIAPHRGFPHDVQSQTVVSHAVGCRVGVAAGICLGDPDVGAVHRIAAHPEVHRVSQLLESGIVVDPATHTVFNSQNTAFIRELAPAMFMMPGVERYDDIYASLICQRVMRERGLHVHFGKPFVWQQRNPHNLVKDLRQEIDGMENVTRLARYLDSVVLPKHDVLANLRTLYHGLNELPNSYDILPKPSIEAALAFLDDIEGVL